MTTATRQRLLVRALRGFKGGQGGWECGILHARSTQTPRATTVNCWRQILF